VSGTTNYVVKFASASTVATGSIYDNGNIGIGTTSPAQKLHVVGNARINGIGAFGIAQSNWDSSIYGIEIGGVGNALWANAGSYIELNNNGYFDSAGWKYANTAASSRYELGIGAHYWFTAASGTAGNALTWSERMRLDNNGNILIGGTSTTNSPIEFQQDGDAFIKRLFVTTTSGNANAYINSQDGYESLIQFGGQTYYNNGIIKYSDASNFMSFWTNATEKMRIVSDGNVGIGLTSPSYNLSISGSVGLQGNEEYLYFHSNYSVGNNARGKIRVVGAGGGSGYGGDLRFSTRKPTNVWNEDALTIDSSGNVGIGTTVPAYILDIVGSSPRLHVKETGTSYSILDIENNAGSFYFAIDNSAGTGFGGTAYAGTIYKQGAYPIAIWTNAVERMRITQYGDVGIGTNNPAHQLEVYDTVDSPTYVRINNQNSGSSAYTGVDLQSYGGGWQVRVPASTTYVNPLVFSFNAAEKVRIASDGNVGIGTTSPAAKLHVTSSASTLAAIFQGNVGVGNQSGYYYGLCSLTKPTSGLNLNIIYGSLSSGYGEILMSNYNDNTGGTGYASYIRSYSNPGNDYASILTFGTSTASSGGPVERMRIAATGNVGIGTTTTPLKLNVSGSIYMAAGNGSAIDWSSDISSQFLKYDSGIDGMILSSWNNTTFYTQQIERVRINSAGNVGIGTTVPAFKLDVSGSAIRSFITAGSGAEPGFIVDYPSSSGYGAFFVHVNNTRRWRIGSVGDTNVQPALNFWQEGTGSRMIINNDGRVGIGTSSPSGNLDVVSSDSTTTYIRGASSALRFLAYADGTNWIQSGTSTSNSSADLIFSSMNGSSQWMRIQGSTGNVGIGTSNPLKNLQINAVTASIRLEDSSASSKRLELSIDANGVAKMSANQSAQQIAFETVGTERIRIAADGNVGIGTTSPTVKLQVYSGAASENTIASIVGDNTNSLIYVPYTATGGYNYASTTGGSGLFNSINSTWWIGTHNGPSIRFTPDGTMGHINSTGTINLYVSGSGYVGIGTTVPAYKLDVIGPATSNGVTLRLSDAASLANSRHILLTRGSVSGSIGIAGSQTEDPLWLSRSSGYDLIVASSGNIGIGTSIPGALLEISSSTAASLLNVKGAGGNGILFVSGSGDVAVGITNPELRFRIDGYNISASNSGTSPTNGILRLSSQTLGSTNLVLDFGVDANSSPVNTWIQSRNRTNYALNYSLLLNPNGGNVGIGTTSPVAKLDIRGGIQLLNSSGSTSSATSGSLMVIGQNTVGGSSYHDFLYTRNTLSTATNPQKTFRLTQVGALEIINDAYTVVILSLTNAGVLSTPGGGTSDIRTKQNVEYIYEDASTTINKLKPVKFEFKDYPNVKRHGFIAQDVLPIKPELVLGDGDKPDGTYGLDYDGILALTVKALQEANAKIEQLETRISQLENK